MSNLSAGANQLVTGCILLESPSTQARSLEGRPGFDRSLPPPSQRPPSGPSRQSTRASHRTGAGPPPRATPGLHEISLDISLHAMDYITDISYTLMQESE